MSDTERELSRKIYQYLCNIVGTEEVVKARRNIFRVMDRVIHIPNLTQISSGSKAEGLHLKGSDYDVMIVSKRILVYENKNVSSFTPLSMDLIMDNSDTKPGFTKLKFECISNGYLWPTNAWVEVVEGEAYFSSKLFREHKCPNDMIIHGPCRSSLDDSFDSARCFWCQTWIKPAHKWILRSRPYWPNCQLVKAIVKHGVLFVPIGCKGSSNEDLEWRISFSMAEKQLIFSFSHTQLLCYALLKIILKDIIKMKHSDLVCSYFLKTIMFWLCEESNPSEWHSGNMIPCFVKCLRRLIYCVQYKTCLHYFIPDNNLFECRFTDYQHRALLDTLHDIDNSLWTYVFHTATFHNFRSELTGSHSPYLTASALPCLAYPKGLHIHVKYSKIKQIITRLIKLKNTELRKYMLSLISNYWMQSQDCSNLIEINKSVYKQYQKRLCCFKAGLDCDVSSTWLLLASLFYKHKRLTECKFILNYCLSKLTPDKIILSFTNTLSEQTLFQKFHDAFGLILTCKHLIINELSFNKPHNLLPVELIPSTKQDACDRIRVFPSVVYLYMLSFLCCHHLGDNRGKLNALRDLQLTIRERYFISPYETHFQIAYTCLKIAKSMM
ncbi:Hypothetical predicted protein [Mytilus galloprovincialis]|uniref:Mab-21-like HhH/H2TH-like domain-containing protein n=1 Tax=Mytilus galloprovincialis TaxID=29158 RepID=A0A8B6HKI4_MYTGA|nr:Hypothetical predicted protein [Mytilus galloprovincialis]